MASNKIGTIKTPKQVMPGQVNNPQSPTQYPERRTYQILRDLETEKAAATLALDDLSNVNAPAPSNGQVLEWVAADAEWEAVTPSTGGNATYSTVEASRPAGAQGDLFLPTDGLQVERKGASVWSPWGVVWPFTPPVDGDFAWVNQGTATVETSRGGIYLADVVGDTSTKGRLRVKTAPATPYTLTVYAKININVARQFLQAGLLFRESSTGKFVSFHLDRGSMWSANWSSATVTTTTPYQSQTLVGAPEWLQIRDDGTNLKLAISRDGYHFIDLYSVGRTAFMAGGPNQIGFFVNSENVDSGADQAIGMWVGSWKES